MRSDLVTPRAAAGILAALMAVAALVRFWAIGFGLPHTQCRPDETAVTGIAIGFFRGDLNPHFFDYPTLYMYALAALYYGYYLVGRLGGSFLSLSHFVATWPTDWTPFFLISRLFAALLGTLTVAVVFRLGTSLFDRTVGLVAAFFLSLAFLHARDSHFGVTDVPVTFLVMAATWFLAKAHSEGRREHFLTAGALGGLATSTKYNAVLLLVPLIVSEIIRIADGRRQTPRPAFDRLPLFVIPFATAFLLGSPFALLDFTQFVSDVKGVGNHLRVGHGIFLGSGWLYHLKVSLGFGVGWPLLVTGLAGAVVLAVRDWRKAALLCSFPVAYYAVAGNSYTVFVRYMVPLVPFVCVTAAYAVVEAGGWIERALGWRARSLAIVLFSSAAVIPSAYSLLRFDMLLGRADNRLVSGRWLREHAALGSSVYQSGSLYGQLQPGRGARSPDYRYWTYDDRADAFRVGGLATSARPDWIVVQESPLALYSHTPAGVMRVVREEYELARAFEAADLSAAGNVYDQQDAFFLPLAGFNGIRRPGPNFYVYKRKSLLSGR